MADGFEFVNAKKTNIMPQDFNGRCTQNQGELEMLQMVSENGGFDQVDQKITSNQPQVPRCRCWDPKHGAISWCHDMVKW
jgi:hypothetical protein